MFKLLTFMLGLFAFAAIITAQNANDRLVLIALYNAAGGGTWKNPWNFQKSLCGTTKTTGVTCDGNQRVVRIQFTNNNLIGTIPTEIGLLDQLLELTLISNPKLVGTIPTEIGQLRNINILDLQTLGITGNIPTEIGLLRRLTKFRIFQAQMTGTIPNQIGNIGTSIDELYLYSTPFTGTIPKSVGKLTSLENFYLYQTNVGGTIPTEVGLLTNLTSIMFYSNQLTGTIPKEIGNIPGLYRIWLYGNQLNGPLTADPFTPLKNLQMLYLDSNNFYSTIPTELGLVTSLQSFRISNSSVFGTIPSEFGNLVNLQECFLFQNSISGTLPTELSGAVSMQRFWTYQNQISGTIPDLSTWKQVVQFRVMDNQLNGTIPTFFGSLPQLQDLWISINQISGTVPQELTAAPSLTRLYIRQNLLEGTLPDFQGSKLTDLLGDNNFLTGTIAPSFGTMTTLQRLDLSNNLLVGVIPINFYNLENLANLQLSNNTLVGVILPDILDLSLSNLMLTLNCFVRVLDYSPIKTNDFDVYEQSPKCILSNYSLAGLADNALSQWRFDIPLALGYDGTGSFNDLLIPLPFTTAPYVRVDNYLNDALDFSPSDNYIPSTYPYTISSEFSLEILLEFPNVVLSNSIPIFLSPQGNPSDRTFSIRITDIGEVQIYSRSTLLGTTVRNIITTAQTYHLVITKYSEDIIYVFVNGRVELQVPSQSLSSLLSNAPQFVNVGQGLNALVDEISIYDFGLTSTQVNFHLSTLNWCLSDDCETGCYANSIVIERCNIKKAQRIALEEFFYSLKGTSWTLPSWNLQVDLCKSFNYDRMNQVSCDDSGNVQSIVLHQRNLAGSIPSSMSNLAQLNTLDLWGNNVDPNIPTSLKQKAGLTITV